MSETPPNSYGALVGAVAERLRSAGLPDARQEARFLVSGALEIAPGQLSVHPERPVAADQAGHVLALAMRRAAREPLSRLLGQRGFLDMELALGPDTLDPRPETELLVDAACRLAEQAWGDRPLRILDLGTGTGCILIGVLRARPGDHGIGIDIAPGAVAVAQDNAQRWGVADRASFQLGDWASGLDGPFDLVLSNPPYIPSADIAALEPEVRDHDPRLALDGGDDGLAAYRLLAEQVPALLASGGFLLVEIGENQGKAVRNLFTAVGLGPYGEVEDFSGKERCILSRKD
ncbi:MAG: peptide chain release factor N(5)-glutamine methyltransferase [Rhodospirillaceae bacterium]